MSKRVDGKTKTVFALLFVLGGMAGLTAASVPLYDLFCRVTGYGGTTQVASEASASVVGDREISVLLDSNVNGDLDWTFKPVQRQFKVKLGETALAFYEATNNSDQPIIGTATFNVSPAKAGIYFNKIECFCFTEQRLEPGETVQMPVQFFVDPEMIADENTEEVTSITLSYTFFKAMDQQVSADVNQ